jgi:hypothetical protein
MVTFISLPGKTHGSKSSKLRKVLILFMIGMNGSPWSVIGQMLMPESLMKKEES